MSIHRKSVLLAAVAALVLAGVGGGMLHVENLNRGADDYAETGQDVLRLLNAYAASAQLLQPQELAQYYKPTAAAEAELFWSLNEEPALARDGVQVYEWDVSGAKDGGADAVEQAGRYFDGIQSVETAKFKLDAIEEIPAPNQAVVRSMLWIRGTSADGKAFESHARFRMWLREATPSWVIERQELLDGRTVTGDRRGFSDVTELAGLDFKTQLNPDFATPEWEPKQFAIVKYAAPGVSAVDYDNDGYDDIFFGDGKRPRLYRNNGDGTFADVTEKAGLPAEMIGVTVAIFADFDNDGDKDLFTGSQTERNRLFRNNGDGVFSDVTPETGLGRNLVTVAAAADYDNDGDLDLYAGRYLDPRVDLPTTLFYTRNSQGNSLFRNDGAFRFTEVTEEAGVREGGLTLGVAWGDYDSDGDQDLYVANDYGRNALFRNNGDGSFADVSKESGTLDQAFGMSASFGDIDNDGDLDLYVSNVRSSQRWYGQAVTLYRYLFNSISEGTVFADSAVYGEILDQLGTDWRQFGDKMVRGNSLLINQGDGTFSDVAEEVGANPHGWFWSSSFFDFDNDGWQDIYAVNGWISGKTMDDI